MLYAIKMRELREKQADVATSMNKKIKSYYPITSNLLANKGTVFGSNNKRKI
jgi:hypothetical protein